MKINGSDQNTLRLFALDLPPEAVERFTKEAGTGEWPLKYALGATQLRSAFVDVVALQDLGDMSLSQYLIEAFQVTGDDFRLMRPQLDALTGHVVILPAQAFDNTSQELTIAMPLRHIGTFAEVRPQPRGALLRTASGHVTRSAATGSARLPIMAKLLLALLVVLALLTLFLVLT